MLHEGTCICGVCIKERNITWVCKHRKPQSVCSECLQEEKQFTFNKPSHKNLTWVYLIEYAEEVVVYTDPSVSVPVTRYSPGISTSKQNQVPDACYLLREEATKTEVHGKPTLATLHVCTEHVVVVDWTAY